jgi:hypothetical protein
MSTMLKTSLHRSLIVLLGALAASCGGGGDSSTSTAPPTSPPPPAGSASTLYQVNVTDTDPAISTAVGGQQHYAYINASATRKNKLFLFFAATGAPPKNYTLIDSAAANAGFHSIGLAYVNGPSTIESLCAGSPDPDCTGKIREETLTGADASPLITVSVTDSIQNRLVKLLIYLNVQHPADNWGQFLDASNNIRWDLLRVSGLSQGGGAAGYIAKTQAVDRACFFSSPADWDDVDNIPGAWVLTPNTSTPPSKIFGFDSTLDPIVPYVNIRKTWTAFGLDPFGAPVSVDGTSTFNGTHELSTSLGDALSAHTSTAADSNTPIDTTRTSLQFPAGTPVYLNVWNYNCFN